MRRFLGALMATLLGACGGAEGLGVSIVARALAPGEQLWVDLHQRRDCDAVRASPNVRGAWSSDLTASSSSASGVIEDLGAGTYIVTAVLLGADEAPTEFDCEEVVVRAGQRTTVDLVLEPL